MNLSLGEFRALVAKAFRGAGYPWGLTEDGAYAARRLAEFGLDSGPMVVRLLQFADGRPLIDLLPDIDAPTTESRSPRCPVCVGATLADRGLGPPLVIGTVVEPLLAGPIIATAMSRTGKVVRLSWDSGALTLGDDRFSLDGALPDGPIVVTAGQSSTPATTEITHTRVELDDLTFDALERFAHRTYAPATDASRQGAGAGLSDND